MTAPSLDGRRFALGDAVVELREHDGVVWGDVHGGEVVHGQLTGTRDGDQLIFVLALVTHARQLVAQQGAARVERAGDDSLGVSGDLAMNEIGHGGTVLFVCTGNFYRSRFAELLFEQRAAAAGLDWRAESRGLRAWSYGVRGRMSQYALDGLAARGVAVPRRALRSPALATPTDMEAATLIIALDETEHRPLVEQYLDAYADRFTFWSVPDVDRLEPDVALAAIEAHVDALVAELALPV